MDKHEEHIEYLKATDPPTVLKDILNGWRPFPSQLDTINEIRKVYGFPNEVINVLIEYVVLARKGFTNADAHAMARFLKRKNVTTAEQALLVIRENIAKRKDA